MAIPISYNVRNIVQRPMSTLATTIGIALVVQGERIIDQATFSAVVVMVIVTTMVTPPALKWSMGRKRDG
jgi:hypothetical protein